MLLIGDMQVTLGQYSFVEFGRRACLLKDGTVIWWGCPADGIPPHIAPITVLLKLSVMRNLWK